MATQAQLFAKIREKPSASTKEDIAHISPPIESAIKRAENNPRNFGVLSEHVDSPEDAEQVLRNSIKNNFLRWLQAGKPDTFVDFMQQRWAPIGAENDPEGLNKNWAPNVKKILEQNLGEEEFGMWELDNLVRLSGGRRFA